MNKKFNHSTFQQWKRNMRGLCKQLAIPFCIFQAIRTFIFPTPFDILLLALLVAVAVGFHYNFI